MMVRNTSTVPPGVAVCRASRWPYSMMPSPMAPSAAAASRACCYIVTWLCHHDTSPRARHRDPRAADARPVEVDTAQVCASSPSIQRAYRGSFPRSRRTRRPARIPRRGPGAPPGAGRAPGPVVLARGPRMSAAASQTPIRRSASWIPASAAAMAASAAAIAAARAAWQPSHRSRVDMAQAAARSARAAFRSRGPARGLAALGPGPGRAVRGGP